jgi:hypothetical protein
VPPTATQASIPAHLLVKPGPAPAIPRTTDPKTGEQKIDGAQVVTGVASLYDYVGAIKGQLDALIDAVAARDAPPPAKTRKRWPF